MSALGPEDLAAALHDAADVVDVDQDPAAVLRRVDPQAVTDAARSLDADDLAAITLIGHIAGQAIVEQLLPGCGSMLIPEKVAAIFAAVLGGYATVWPNIVPTYQAQLHDLRLETLTMPGGPLQLRLTWHGGQPVWTGVLRAAGPGDQHDTKGTPR